jgi:leader peptidase (prepilin peptidase)/N-methyltransferase
MAENTLAHLAIGMVLTALLVPIVRSDIAERRIPNRLTATGAIVLMLVQAVVPGGALLPALLWGAMLAVSLGMLALLAPDGFGMGDAKLAGVLGLALGPDAIFAVILACLATGVFGIAVAVRSGLLAARTRTVPFAPYLAAGAAVAWMLATA